MTKLFTPSPLLMTGFGFTLIPEWHYQDLIDENQIKRDRVTELTDANEGLRNRLGMTTDGKKLAEANLYDANERVKSLGQENKTLESTRIRNLAQLNSLRLQVEKLKQGDRAANELIEGLNSHVATLKENLQTAQKELDAIKENYRKALAANTELELKLGEAIANLSATELQCNEQTVKISTLAQPL